MSGIGTVGGFAAQATELRALSGKFATVSHNDAPPFHPSFRGSAHGAGVGDIAPVALEHFDPIPGNLIDRYAGGDGWQLCQGPPHSRGVLGTLDTRRRPTAYLPTGRGSTVTCSTFDPVAGRPSGPPPHGDRTL